VVENLTKLEALSAKSAEKVEALLRLARVGHDEAEFAPIDIDAAIQSAWEELTLQETSPPRLDMAATLKAPFVSNPNAFQIVLLNLLSNALKYRDPSKPENWVRVTAKQDRDWLELAVIDNGVGVPKDQQKAIFGMFQKLTDHPGDGLGLAIVKRQVDMLGGEVWCSSNQEDNVIFTVRLPLKAQVA
jgi:signal transduction histidine kinase